MLAATRCNGWPRPRVRHRIAAAVPRAHTMKKIETVAARNEKKRSMILNRTGANRAKANVEANSWSMRFPRVRRSTAFNSRMIRSLSDIRQAALSLKEWSRAYHSLRPLKNSHRPTLASCERLYRARLAPPVQEVWLRHQEKVAIAP